MGWARTEKNALVDTFRRADPEAPTLCTGWSTRRLLAHLVQREQDVRGTLGDAVSRPEPGQEKHLGRLADSAATPEGYAALVDRFVAGAPRWSPFSWAADQTNLLEYVIHHEDVRRGSGDAEPRELSVSQTQAIWRQLPLMARLQHRRVPVPVVLARADGARSVVVKGDDPVVLTGEPVELALHVSGRRSAARVQVSGSPSAVSSYQAWLDAKS